MSDVAARHKQIMAADARGFTRVGGAVYGDVFPKAVVIADLHFRGGTIIFQVLWGFPDAAPAEELVMRADTSAAGNVRMRAYPAPGSYFHFAVDYRIGSNADRRIELRA
jgi:hypothetical protein